jgi:predicted metal-dependent HD superfamily phosphohydrolase
MPPPCRSRWHAEAVDPHHLLPDLLDALRRAGARAPVAELEGAGIDLLRRWNEPHRGYHDARHLTEILSALTALADAGVPGAQDPAVRLAAWFHDAVYEGRPGDDERASADLAHAELRALAVPPVTADRVRALVLVTAAHEPPPGDDGAAALCDADLAVLAAAPARYAQYVAGVRREYAHVEDGAFTGERAAVLRRLLERPALFTTATGRARWEAAARENLAAELERLHA